ncbi:MAG: CaiB/BaiF CoA transferase family protein [Lishizhenia sp.]
MSFIKNLKVIDLSTVLAGPSVGMFFAELGACVTKVEHPTHKDVTRTWKLSTENKKSDVSAYFSSVNYAKEYISLNLSNATDKKEFLSLISTADILLMNFKKGDQEKFNITDNVLQRINPRLIIGKINGFGTDSDRVAYDLILQAESGFMSMNGDAVSPPTKMPVALIDVLAAHQLKEGILTALLNRTINNLGEIVTVSLYESAVSSLVNQASNYLMEDFIPQRIGSLHPNIAPYGEIFETKDKKLITFAIGSQKQFEKLAAILELTHLISDSRFITNQSRIANRSELKQLLEEKISTLESENLLNVCHSKYIPAGEIKNLHDVFQTSLAQQLIREEIIEGKHTKRVSSIAFKFENGNH